MTYLALLAGFVFLLVGGEFLVRGAAALALRFGLSNLVVGIIIVGFGTSVPELVASIQAALAGAPGIAIGNVVGSNIANILLILGAGAVIYPVICSKAAVFRDGFFMVVTAA
ncbi:MAG: sodium:calcium antiporter, partial [Anderseniella sp.]